MLSTTLDRIIDQISRPIVPIFTCKLKQMHSQEEREQRFTNPRGIERAQPLNLEKATRRPKKAGQLLVSKAEFSETEREPIIN